MRALLAWLCTPGIKRALLKGWRDTSGFDIASKVPNQCCESGATAEHPSDLRTNDNTVLTEGLQLNKDATIHLTGRGLLTT